VTRQHEEVRIFRPDDRRHSRGNLGIGDDLSGGALWRRSGRGPSPANHRRAMLPAYAVGIAVGAPMVLRVRSPSMGGRGCIVRRHASGQVCSGRPGDADARRQSEGGPARRSFTASTKSSSDPDPERAVRRDRRVKGERQNGMSPGGRLSCGVIQRDGDSRVPMAEPFFLPIPPPGSVRGNGVTAA
jgi:hypothetical protein